MKNIFKILFVFLLTSNSFANELYHNSIGDKQLVINDEKHNLNLIVSVNENDYKYSKTLNSFDDFEITDMGPMVNEIENDIINSRDFCTVTISTTVSVGYDSNFIQVTVSLEAPCDSWKEDLRNLISDVREIINNA